MKTELGITKGEWFVEENTNHYPFVMAYDNNVVASLFRDDGTLFYGRELSETEANAKLIADAGKTANETGLLPSQLLAQRDEALFRLNELVYACTGEQRDVEELENALGKPIVNQILMCWELLNKTK